MNRKSSIVCEYGINDMPRGWTKANKYNYRVYQLWHNMINRCYNEKYHKSQPTYINTTLQLEWHWLSQFIEDISKINGFDYELFMSGKLELDKDIKSNGTNKCYCLENCMFVSHEENNRQANKTRDNEYLKGENNPMYGKPRTNETKKKISEAQRGKPQLKSKLINRYTLDEIYIDTHYNFEYVQMGFNATAISHCCKGHYKSHKGFIFKYCE